MQLEGVITALVTPFKGREFDAEGLQRNIEFQLENNIQGLMLGGSTGEAPTLDLDEYEQLIQVATRTIDKRVPLIVNIGESATKRALLKIEIAMNLGAEALLAVTPAYSRPTQEGLYQHFRTLADSTKLPIILYNNPVRTGVSLEVETLLRLSKIDTIIGIKDASGSMFFVEDILSNLPPSFTVLSGDDPLSLPMIALGAKGVFSTLSNLMPSHMADLVEAALSSNFEAAREKQKALYPFFKACMCETNPVPIKTMMELAGMAAGPCRLPLAPLKKDNYEMIEMLLKKSQELLAYHA